MEKTIGYSGLPCTTAPKLAMASQEAQEGRSFELPLLGLCYRRPTEGLPLLQDWVSNARDIFTHGYEGHRESIEVRHSSDMWPEVLEYGSTIPVKGLGKVSILFFGLVFTYLRLRDSLTEAELQDFKRLDQKGRLWISCKFKVAKVMVSLKPSPLGILRMNPFSI